MLPIFSLEKSAQSIVIVPMEEEFTYVDRPPTFLRIKSDLKGITGSAPPIL